jgi:hypothetical protein
MTTGGTPPSGSGSKKSPAVIVGLTVGYYVWWGAVAIAAIVGGTLLRNYCRPRDLACNVAVDFGALHGARNTLDCTLYSAGDAVAPWMRIAGIIALIIGIGAFLVTLVALPKAVQDDRAATATSAPSGGARLSGPAPQAGSSAQLVGEVLRRVSRAELLGGAAAILLFADLSLHWTRYVYAAYPNCNNPDQACGPPSYYSGWTAVPSGIQWVIVLACLATLIVVGAKMRGRSEQTENPRLLWLARGRLGAAGLASLLILYEIISPPAEFGGATTGAILGLLLAFLLTYSGYRAYRAMPSGQGA